MTSSPKLDIIPQEDSHENDDDDFSRTSSPLELNKIYQLARLTRSSINSGIYAVTGIKLDQKKLVISFIFTLVKDFALAYTVRGSLKLIPKLLKMLQILK